MPKRHAKRKQRMNVPGPTRSDADSNHTQSRGTHARIRLTSGLLGLSSAAILSVYGLGYLNTSTASGSNLADIAATPTPHASTVSRPGSTPTPQAQVGYKDGTYVGRVPAATATSKPPSSSRTARSSPPTSPSA